MLVNGLRKCFLSMLFIVCPNKLIKNSIIALPAESEDYVNRVLNKPVLNPYLTVPAKWAVDVIKRDKDNDVNKLDDDEPGFEFDDGEMYKFKIWNNGIIPFYIDDFSFDKVLRDMIRGFLDAVNDVTGLRFVELTRPPENKTSRWVFFLNRRGILNVDDHPIKEFTNTGVQKVVLGYDSMCTRGELPKAVLALVGVPPQHNAPNRDEFVTVVPENIQPDKLSLFDKLKDDEWLFHDVPYDYASASHYHFHQYTINGFATVKPKHCKKPIPTAVGEGNGFSYSDILKIRMLYNYISKKISQKESISDCAELFIPGPNLTHSSKPKLIMKPRKKPNKYLGLAKDTNTNNRNEEIDEEDENDDNSESVITKDQIVDHCGINDDNKIKLSTTNQTLKNKTVRKKPNKNYMSKYCFHTGELFKQMSDYKTDENQN